MKYQRLGEISEIINDSRVKLSGVSYWSLTDNIDSNLERVRANLLSKGIIDNINQVPTVCGGLMPTSQQYANIMGQNNYQNPSEHHHKM